MTNQSTRTVWGVGTSRTLRAHWALHELQLEFAIEPIRTRTPDTETERFKSVNPKQKIPVLHDGEVRIAESNAIVTYLAERYEHPEAPLIPTDVAARAKYFEWLCFIAMELDATSLYVLRRHESLPEIYGEAPQANIAAKAYFARMINSAARLMRDDDGFLLGPNFSGVDIAMGTTLDWAVNYGQPLPDVFEAYLRRVLSRSPYAAATRSNQVPEA